MASRQKRKAYTIVLAIAATLSALGTATPASANTTPVPPKRVYSAAVNEVITLKDPTSTGLPSNAKQFADPEAKPANKVTTRGVFWPTSIRDLIRMTALSQIGYTASYSGWTKYGAWYGYKNPGNQYGDTSYGAWCAMFTSWVYAAARHQRGIESYKGMANVYNGFDILRSKGKAYPMGSRRPPYVMDLMSIRSPDGHVGLAYGPQANMIRTIEGNSYYNKDGRSKVRWRLRYPGEIIEYGSPL